MTLLVTPTLLNAVEFAKNAPPSWRQSALSDLTAKLRREKSTFPDWVKKGSVFEDAVYNHLMGTVTFKGSVDVTDPAFLHVCEACKGGTFQDVRKRTIPIPGYQDEALFYCKLDVLKPEKIIDIKTTLNYKGPSKYLSGYQHQMYCLCAERSAFEYIVVEWEGEKGYDIRNIHTVPYTAPDPGVIVDELKSAIIDALEFIERKNLFDDYYFTFSKNK